MSRPFRRCGRFDRASAQNLPAKRTCAPISRESARTKRAGKNEARTGSQKGRLLRPCGRKERARSLSRFARFRAAKGLFLRKATAQIGARRIKRGLGRREGVFYAPAGGKSGRVRFRFCTLSGRQGAFSAESNRTNRGAKNKARTGSQKGRLLRPCGRKERARPHSRFARFRAAKGPFSRRDALPCAFTAKTVFSARTAHRRAARSAKNAETKIFRRMGEWAAQGSFRQSRARRPRGETAGAGGDTKKSHRKRRATSKKRLACQKGGSGTKNRTERVGAAAKTCGGAHSFILTKTRLKTDKGFAF